MKLSSIFKPAAFFSLISAANPIQAQEFCEDSALRLSYMPVAMHLTDKDAPDGGYNETSNHGIAIALKCDIQESPLYYAVGLTTFSNSLFKDSNGVIATLGYETNIGDNTSIFGEVNVGVVTGYEHLPQMMDGISPYGIFNVGITHQNLSVGVGYIPGSLAGSDDVIVPNVSYTIPLGEDLNDNAFDPNAVEIPSDYNVSDIKNMGQWRLSM